MPDVVCFGPFELDTRTGDLRKRGKSIRLAPQPASLLTLLANSSRSTRHARRDPSSPVERRSVRRLRTIAERVPRASSRVTAASARTPRGVGTFKAWVIVYRPGAPVAAVSQPTVAVLPLANLTSDPALEVLRRRLHRRAHHRVGLDLGAAGDLPPVSDSPQGHFSHVARDRERAGADALIEGSVVCEAARVRLSVQLTAPSPERHLWAKVYDCGPEEVIGFHRQVRARSLTPSARRLRRPSSIGCPGCRHRSAGAGRVRKGPLSRHDVERGALRRGPRSLRGGRRARSNLRSSTRRVGPHVVPLAYWGHLP